MSALLVGQVRVRDVDKWAVYVAGVAASLAPHPDAEVRRSVLKLMFRLQNASLVNILIHYRVNAC
jgi:hypothetical protein